MNAIVSAAPFANLLGFRDNSARPPVLEPEALPTHLPLVFLYAERGPLTPELVSGSALSDLYGASTLDMRSPYYNHQSLLANTLQGAGNAIFVQRVLADDAGPKARLLLSLDIVADKIPRYQRNADGSFRLTDGAKVATGETVDGYRARWVLNDITDHTEEDSFGAQPTQAGSLEGDGGVQSTVYPILELEAAWHGGYGNNIGIRLSAPHGNSPAAMNTTIAKALQAYMFRLSIVTRPSVNMAPTEIPTIFGEKSIDFAFKPDAIYLRTDQDFSLESQLEASYSDRTPGFTPLYAPFGRVHLYQSNLDEILSNIAEAEATFGLVRAGDESIYEINPITGTDFEGVPYHSFAIEGVANGGLLFSSTSTHYATGASDGTMNDESFDLAVRNEVLNFGVRQPTLLDMLKTPYSIIYDTGFDLDTKFPLLATMGKRVDTFVVASTHEASGGQLTAATESSMASSLQAYARNFPESTYHGTPVARAMITGHSGKLVGSKYRKFAPIVIELAQKTARWMSPGSGIWNPGMAIDLSPNNRVTMFRDVNTTYKDARVRNADWNNGLVWVQTYDRNSVFWPAFQTVYPDDSSVLNSFVTALIACDLQKVAMRTWRDLTGIAGLTDLQFADRSDRLIRDQVRGRYDGRVTIVPETFYSAADEQRGYSWSCNIHMYAPNMKTVGTFTIDAHRLSDLAEGA